MRRLGPKHMKRLQTILGRAWTPQYPAQAWSSCLEISLELCIFQTGLLPSANTAAVKFKTTWLREAVRAADVFRLDVPPDNSMFVSVDQSSA